jgi:hypothetical protein
MTLHVSGLAIVSPVLNASKEPPQTVPRGWDWQEESWAKLTRR